MVVGIGVDVCDVRRMARELARDGAGFTRAVFTSAEIRDASARAVPARHFAARFAAKEAALKALGTGLPDTGALREIEVRLHGTAPRLAFRGRMADLARERHVTRAHLTMAHDGAAAVAHVLLESEDRRVP